mgnify:CR=1 FL=1
MYRIATSLSQRYRVGLMGRMLPGSPALPRSWPFEGIRLPTRAQKGKSFYAEHNWRLYHALIEQKPDLIGAVDADTLMACSQAARRLAVPLVYDSHEYFTQVPELEGRPWVRAIWHGLEKRCIRPARLCYTVNEALASVLSQRLGKSFGSIRNVPLLHGAMEEEMQEGAMELPERFVLYQGALNAGRGLEMLLDIAAQMPDLQVVLCGEGDLSRALRQQKERLGLGDRVQFLGRISPSQLRRITRQAFLGYNVLAPMGLSYYYSLANKFFDYMHAGIPSLNSAFPAYEKIISSTGCGWTTAFDVDDVKAALSYAWSHPEETRQVGWQALQAAPQYCWENEEKKLLQLYDSLSV